MAANWKLIVENFMECYHCATIHPELTEVLPEFTEGFAAQYFVGHGAEFGPEIQGFTVDGSAGLDRIPGVADEQDRRYYAITVKPQVFINLVPDHVIVHRMFPLAADRTIVECDWLYLPSVVVSGQDLDRSVELFDRVNRQDFDACERCQPAMSSRVYADGGVLVPSEHHIAAFHDWLRGAAGRTRGAATDAGRRLSAESPCGPTARPRPAAAPAAGSSDAGAVEPVGRTRDTDRRDHLAGVITNRCGDRVEPLFVLLDRHAETRLDDSVELGQQRSAHG